MEPLEYEDFAAVKALLRECDNYQSNYIDEHSGYLRNHLKELSSHKSYSKRQEDWSRISNQFHALRTFIDSVISQRSVSGDSGTNGRGIQ